MLRRSRGVLNVATGTSTSFREVADMVMAGFDTGTKGVATPRRNPITHVHFDTTDCVKAFPDFAYTSLAEGLIKAQEEGGQA